MAIGEDGWREWPNVSNRLTIRRQEWGIAGVRINNYIKKICLLKLPLKKPEKEMNLHMGRYALSAAKLAL